MQPTLRFAPSRVVLASLLSLLFACRALGQDAPVVTLGEGENARTYIEHVPTDLDPAHPAPLLLVFHGGGGSAEKAMESFGFDPLVEQAHVLIVYPNGIEGHWNDGRGGAKFAEQDARVDDVAYTLEILADMQRRHAVNPTRIYAVGVSNGGMFVQRLAIEHPQAFTAVASIISSIPEPLAANFHPSQPLSVLFMNGTDDPIVPFGGGEVTIDFFPRLPNIRKKKSRGRVIATEKAVGLWVSRDGLDPVPETQALPNVKKWDGTKVERQRWTKEDSDIEVVLYRIIGGGHTLPGKKQYLPARVIGRTSGDIDAVQTIWSFLSSKRSASDLRSSD